MPTTILSVENLSKRFGAEKIFSGVTFQIRERDRIGLVGVNGAGKSTLLRILAGLEQPDSGTLIAQHGLRLGYLAQEAAIDPGRTVLDAALEAMEDLRQLGQELERLAAAIADASGETLERLLAEYEQKSLRFEAAGGYDLEHRATQVLAGLGFEEVEFSRPAGQLSGGQRTRLALARALLADPDLLLLDEPTNHLDLRALTWLETFLRTWRGSFVVVSHDRYFLDQVTERTLELSFGHLEDYPGNYSRYLELRHERLARRLAEYEAQQEFIRKEEEFIRRYKAGQRAREARGRATRLARLERIERPREHETLRLQLTTGLRSGRIVLTTSELVIGYPASDGSEPVVLCRTPELIVERGGEQGILEAEEEQMIHAVIELGDRRLHEVMVPRPDIVALPASATIDEAVEVIVREGHSRIPVYEESIDEIVGILYAKDLLPILRDGAERPPLRSILRTPVFVPESMPIDDLLHELQRRKVHLAIVLDEYGGTAGLVTIEDLLEEIVGEIQDEYDTESPLIERVGADEAIVDGRISLDEVSDIFEVRLEDEETTTIGGLVQRRLGHIPQAGERVEIDGLRIEVLSVDRHRVRKLRIVKPPMAGDASPAPSAKAS